MRSLLKKIKDLESGCLASNCYLAALPVLVTTTCVVWRFFKINIINLFLCVFPVAHHPTRIQTWTQRQT